MTNCRAIATLDGLKLNAGNSRVPARATVRNSDPGGSFACHRSRLLLVGVLLWFPVAGLADERLVQSLDGPWQIVFDHRNVGKDGQWFREGNFPKDRQQTIAVPTCWELLEQDYEGVAFYRRKFRSASSWSGQTIRLQFDAVNYLTEVWLNDEVVGFHEGGFTPFEFRVDNLHQASGQENTLILRVVGPIILQDKNIDGVGPLETPQWRGGIAGGIWQSVRLVATGEATGQRRIHRAKDRGRLRHVPSGTGEHGFSKQVGPTGDDHSFGRKIPIESSPSQSEQYLCDPA